MITCIQCNQRPAAASFALCAECLRTYPDRKKLVNLHRSARNSFGLPEVPPKSHGGVPCTLCANRCLIAEGETGYCGIRKNTAGKLVERVPEGEALAHMYLDLLPTNCCASWFCKGSMQKGYNLAVFFYGCNFDCMYCQNFQHKHLEDAETVSMDDLVGTALQDKVKCVCFFGGSPEPQFCFALSAAQRIVKARNAETHICWEWNGSGDAELMLEAVRLSKESGGTVKFDLKAYDKNLHAALCGVDNRRTLENFTLAAESCTDKDVINATTLLVPSYVDAREVESIASFIANIRNDIPYSLLVFHPDYLLDDLPVTPRDQVYQCYDTACRYLSRVNIGNKQLL
jgi:pyruvate formate lyase activating enzyme